MLLNWLDDPDAVDALLIEVLNRGFVELEVEMNDAQLLAVAEHEHLADVVVRHRSQEHRRVVDLTVRQHKQVAEHGLTVASAPPPSNDTGVPISVDRSLVPWAAEPESLLTSLGASSAARTGARAAAGTGSNLPSTAQNPRLSRVDHPNGARRPIGKRRDFRRHEAMPVGEVRHASKRAAELALCSKVWRSHIFGSTYLCPLCRSWHTMRRAA